jgi:hypothetical protein
MAEELQDVFKGAKITKKASPESLRQSRFTRQLLKNVSTQLKNSKDNDWPVGMPSMSAK